VSHGSGPAVPVTCRTDLVRVIANTRKESPRTTAGGRKEFLRLSSSSNATHSSGPTTASREPKELLLGKDGGTRPEPRSQPDLKAREPHIDIAEVIGSNPIAPTTGFLSSRTVSQSPHL